MNPVFLYFASGESLYLGAGLLLLMVVTTPYLMRRWLLRLRNIVTWMALAMIVMACPPFEWAVYAIFAALFVLWFIACNHAVQRRRWSRLRVVTGAILFLMLLAVSVVEFSHRKIPVIEGATSDHLAVIGDSISSGIDTRVPPWPDVMQQMTGVEVRNLARPGATVIEGQAMAERLKPEDRLVLIEIGGNDLIAGAPSDAFARGLEAILAKVAVPGRTVVMFELPLLPHKIAYGQAQRRLAAKYGIWLIPKRYLAAVMAGKDATSDGLHLTEAGARRMALLVTQLLSPVLKTAPDKSTTPATHP